MKTESADITVSFAGTHRDRNIFSGTTQAAEATSTTSRTACRRTWIWKSPAEARSPLETTTMYFYSSSKRRKKNMKKKIVAYLLCMAMGVSLLPMPVTQAADQGAVVYEEDTTTGEEQDSYVQIKGLKAFADCGNATNKPDAIVDGDKSTYWHSAWKGEMQPEKQEAYTEMSKNNNIILKLAQTSAVKKIVYLSNGENSNGTISKCNLYIKQKQDNTEKFEQVGNEPYTLKFDQSGVAEIDF